MPTSNQPYTHSPAAGTPIAKDSLMLYTICIVVLFFVVIPAMLKPTVIIVHDDYDPEVARVDAQWEHEHAAK
jgi:hypothetical protein